MKNLLALTIEAGSGNLRKDQLMARLVYERIWNNRHQISTKSLREITELRIDAQDKVAEEVGKLPSTVLRQLKSAIARDKVGTVRDYDRMVKECIDQQISPH